MFNFFRKKNQNIQKTDPKFKYGLDVNVYLDKAIEIIKERNYYHWADLSQFNEQYTYAIEKESAQYHFIRYTKFSNETEKEVLDVNPLNSWDKVNDGDQFIECIIKDNIHEILNANPKIDNYKVDIKPHIKVDTFNIERYEFNKHRTGDYSVFVEAGNRMTGFSREFFIPPHFLKGTFDELLEKYLTLVPGSSFGLNKEDLNNDKQLKNFLGFR